MLTAYRCIDRRRGGDYVGYASGECQKGSRSKLTYFGVIQRPNPESDLSCFITPYLPPTCLPAYLYKV